MIRASDDWRHATHRVRRRDRARRGDPPVRRVVALPGNPKMSMRVRSTPSRAVGKFGGVDVLKLKGFYGESSMLRDRTRLLHVPEGDADAAAAHARVVVNGELRGVFGAIEVWESDAAQGALQPAARRALSAARVKGTDPYLYIGRQPELLRAGSRGSRSCLSRARPTTWSRIPEGPRGPPDRPSSRPPTSTTCSRTWRSTRSSTTPTGSRVTPASRTTTSTSTRPAGSSSFSPWDPDDTLRVQQHQGRRALRSTPGSARAGCSRSSRDYGTYRHALQAANQGRDGRVPGRRGPGGDRSHLRADQGGRPRGSLQRELRLGVRLRARSSSPTATPSSPRSFEFRALRGFRTSRNGLGRRSRPRPTRSRYDATSPTRRARSDVNSPSGSYLALVASHAVDGAGTSRGTCRASRYASLPR